MTQKPRVSVDIGVLALDGIAVSHPDEVTGEIEEELARLLAGGERLSGSAVPSPENRHGKPGEIGAQVASAVYNEVGRCR